MTIPNRFTRSDPAGIRLNQNFQALYGDLQGLQPRFCVAANTSLSVPNTTNTVVALTAVVDPWGWVSGSAVAPDVPGYYKAIATVRYGSAGPFPTRSLGFIDRSDGPTVGHFDLSGIGAGPVRLPLVTPIFYMDGATHSLSVTVWHNAGATLTGVDVDLSVELFSRA